MPMIDDTNSEHEESGQCKGRPTLETKHVDPRSGTVDFAAVVASTATAERIRIV